MSAERESSASEPLRTATRVYLAAFVLLSSALAGWLLLTRAAPRPDADLALLLAALQALAVAFPLPLAPRQKLSLHAGVVLAAALLLPPGPAMLVCATGTLGAQVARRQPPDQTLFNAAQAALQAGVAGLLLGVAGHQPGALDHSPRGLAAILLAVVTIEATNVLSVGAIVALESGEPLARVARSLAGSVSLASASQYGLGLIGALLLDAHRWALPVLLLLAFEVYRSSARHLRLREQADVLAHRAYHDALTDLPNRAMFHERLEQALARARRSGASVAVLFLDLDRFKAINDTFGHAAGDELLVAVARRLRSRLRLEDTLARLGGDEFTILAGEVEGPPAAIALAERLIDTIQRPFSLRRRQVHVAASVGIALGNGEGDADELIQRADVALYQAKHDGRGGWALYDARRDAGISDRWRLEADLRDALARDELRLHYQPAVDLASGRITGVEALVRWQHPRRGLVAPGEFIRLAEETGLIVPLGRWVIDEACRQAIAWRGAFGTTPRMSVNLSARQLRERGFVDGVAATLADSGLPASDLVVEITEGMLVQQQEEALTTLYALKQLGVQLAIDDFGVGYASLSYLKRLPADGLKIDRSFVRGVSEDAGDQAIVHAVCTLAGELRLWVIAEGVETPDQAERLRAMGCGTGQGYLFARPSPPDVITELIARDVATAAR